jgi:hypothetical protein
MSEFIFLPPPGSATQKSVTTEPVNASVQNLTQNAASEPFVFFAHPTEEKKQSEGNYLPVVASAGAAAGALARHKGVETKNVFKPGENVYQAPQKTVDALNQHLRTITGDANVDVRGMTNAQIDRILQGGEGSTLGTTGAQRGYGYQNEQQRRSRNQHEVENLVKKISPNLPDPIVQAGQTVPLPSGIEVPVNVARQHAADTTTNTQRAISEAQKSMKTSGIKSGAAKVGAGALGGGLSAAQAYEMATQKTPADWSQYLSLLGGLGATFGGPRAGVAGGLAQLPYAIKNREAIMRGMTGTEVNPTAFPIGMPGADEPVVGYKP